MMIDKVELGMAGSSSVESTVAECVGTLEGDFVSFEVVTIIMEESVVPGWLIVRWSGISVGVVVKVSVVGVSVVGVSVVEVSVVGVSVVGVSVVGVSVVGVSVVGVSVVGVSVVGASVVGVSVVEVSVVGGFVVTTLVVGGSVYHTKYIAAINNNNNEMELMPLLGSLQG